MTPQSSRRHHAKQSGFTLVEVLVALVLLAMVLGAGLRVSASLTQQAQRQDLQGLAQLCADNQLVALRLSPVWLAPGERQAQCPQLQHRFTTRTRLSATPNPSVVRVDIQVMLNGEAMWQVTTVMGRY